MQISIIGLTAALLAVSASPPAHALDCADADPLRVTAKAYGDFELSVDPNDAARHMIYVNHVSNGPSSIVVARMDGVTGQMDGGTLTTIADNFQGKQVVNGPEFVHPPGLGFGVLYRALNGVHGVFRPAAPKTWNDFTLDVNGAPSTTSPPMLSSSYPASYESGGQPLGQNTYTLLDGRCSLRCFASVRGGIPTDAAKVFEQSGLTIPSSESVVQGTREGEIEAEACTRHNAANGTCAIYQATIDGAGGFTTAPAEVSSLPHQVGPGSGRTPLAIGSHPATGTNVLFFGGSHEGGQTIDVFEQKVDGGPATQVASVPADRSDHYRVLDNGSTTMILHFLVRHGTRAGSYILPVTASAGGLKVGGITQIADVANGAEVEYLPAAAKFAIFYRISSRPSIIQRCFFTP